MRSFVVASCCSLTNLLDRDRPPYRPFAPSIAVIGPTEQRFQSAIPTAAGLASRPWGEVSVSRTKRPAVPGCEEEKRFLETDVFLFRRLPSNLHTDLSVPIEMCVVSVGWGRCCHVQQPEQKGPFSYDASQELVGADIFGR